MHLVWSAVIRMRRTRAQDDGWRPEQGLIRHGPWICSTSSAALITDRSSQMGLCICPNKQKPFLFPIKLHLSIILPLRLVLLELNNSYMSCICSNLEREQESNWKRQQSGERVPIRGDWSLWTMAARFKAPQKEPSSAMTDSADKRWSMKADRCVDSRREALAPAGRVHYCGHCSCQSQTGPQLSAMPPAWRHIAKTEGLGDHCIPLLNIHRQLYFTTSFWFENQPTGVEVNLFQQFPDILTMCSGMQGWSEWRVSDR